MSDDRLPWMPLYTDDFLGGTALWAGPERALYAFLLILEWASGPLPASAEKLARVVGYDLATFRALWKTVGVKFEPTGDGLANRRLEEVRARSLELKSIRSDLGKFAAAARWQKDAKGNAVGNAVGIAVGNGEAKR